MRYVITYFNKTKEKRYYYVIVILNIGVKHSTFFDEIFGLIV